MLNIHQTKSRRKMACQNIRLGSSTTWWNSSRKQSSRVSDLHKGPKQNAFLSGETSNQLFPQAFLYSRLPSSCSQGHSVSLADSPSCSQGHHVFLLGLFCCCLSWTVSFRGPFGTNMIGSEMEGELPCRASSKLHVAICKHNFCSSI